MTDTAAPKPPRDMTRQIAARKHAALQRRLKTAQDLLGEHGYTIIPPGHRCGTCKHPAATHGPDTGRCYYGDCGCLAVTEPGGSAVNRAESGREKIAVTVAFLALVTWYVMPRKQHTQKIIEAHAHGITQLMQVMTAVRERDEAVIPELREMTPADRARATEGLQLADLEWVNTMLMWTDPETEI